MDGFDYEELLDRARERIPEGISQRSRWTMPEPEILIEGSQTILRNFSDVVDAMDRDANHVYQYLLNPHFQPEDQNKIPVQQHLKMGWKSEYLNNAPHQH